MDGVFMQFEKGDIVFDVVNEYLWVITSIKYSLVDDDYKYEIACLRDLDDIVIVNERVVTYMRADYIKRTKNVLANKP